MPKIFRLKKKGKLNRSIFEGSTINTPSMLCVEDYLDALEWADGIGLPGLIERSKSNLRVVEEWVNRTDWIDFLTDSEDIRSHTSVCLIITAEAFTAMPKEEQSTFIKDIAGTLSRENIAHDTGSYKEAPPGFRFWCGPTVEAEDLRRALEGLETIYLKKTKYLQLGGSND